MDTREGYVLVCRKWITLKNGRRLYASQIGKKAICFWVKAEDA